MESFFLGCFIFGALFTLASVVLGFAGGLHLPHLGHAPAGGHLGHAGQAPAAGHAPHLGHGHAADGGHLGHLGHLGHDEPVQLGHGHATLGHAALGHGHAAHAGGGTLPLLNASSAVGGLTWFGAVGYLLLRLADWAAPAVIIGALIGGAAGWYLIARFIGFVLQGERELDPEDFRLEGTLGRITVSVPAGGTGEVVFSQAGTRHSAAARGLGGAPIARGTEVVITHFADGFATVQPWAEFLAARDSAATGTPGASGTPAGPGDPGVSGASGAPGASVAAENREAHGI